MKFIGRSQELAQLKRLKNKASASLAVLKGRRRIGKSRLAEEFGKDYTFFSFTGLVPAPQTNAIQERRAFALQLEKYFHVPLRYDNWLEMFQFLAEQTQNTDAVILLDEISWMGAKDPEFLGHLKMAWDLYFKKNDRLVLILCGSISAWIDRNILSNTGFLGRISLYMTLKELPLHECALFWQGQKGVSAFEKLKVLSVTGGIPRYLEEIDPHKTAEENIQDLCFNPSGILFHEFQQIFNDLFGAQTTLYQRIVEALMDGPKNRETLVKILDSQSGGGLTEHLDNLIQAGFIQRDRLWHLDTHQESRLSTFRLSDNYVRFYLKCIHPNRSKIEQDGFAHFHIQDFPGWSALLGLQFENLVLNNRATIQESLGISPQNLLRDGPYWQRATNRQPGCQIDYLMQTRDDTLYVCEIKFSKHPIGMDIIPSMTDKLDRLKAPKHLSKRPILIHVNGITDDLEDAHFFRNIVCFSNYLDT